MKSILSHSTLPVEKLHTPRSVSSENPSVAQNAVLIIDHFSDSLGQRYINLFEKTGTGFYTQVPIKSTTYKVEYINNTQTKITKLSTGVIDFFKVTIFV